jgi:Domain of unknown function (DUF4417)
MRDVGGTLRFDDLRLATSVSESLRRFIPQVDTTEIAPLDAELRWPAYAVGLRRVFSPRTHEIFPQWRGRTAREVLGLDVEPVLLGYGEDPLVEGYWTRRRVDRLAETIAGQEWALVLAPNFSMYANQPRAEHLINFRRNLITACELAAAGVPAVPNIYWLRLEDLERYLDWAMATEPAALACNVQTFRTVADWEQLALPGLTLLAAALPEQVRMIITGASRADRIGLLVELFGDRLTLISQNPLQYARHGAVMTPNGRLDAHARVEDAFAANVRYYASLLQPLT